MGKRGSASNFSRPTPSGESAPPRLPIIFRFRLSFRARARNLRPDGLLALWRRYGQGLFPRASFCKYYGEIVLAPAFLIASTCVVEYDKSRGAVYEYYDPAPAPAPRGCHMAGRQ